MVSPKDLRRYDLFDFMGDKELESVAAIARETEYQAGDVIIESGQPAETRTQDVWYLIPGGG